jgi:hypothetical protein
LAVLLLTYLIHQSLKPIIFDAIVKDSHFRTDESGVYWNVGEQFASHRTVVHSIGEYVRGDAAYKSSREPTALETRYLGEFDFCNNYRVALGLTDKQRTDAIMRGIAGKRLTYRRTRSQEAEAGTA